MPSLSAPLRMAPAPSAEPVPSTQTTYAAATAVRLVARARPARPAPTACASSNARSMPIAHAPTNSARTGFARRTSTTVQIDCRGTARLQSPEFSGQFARASGRHALAAALGVVFGVSACGSDQNAAGLLNQCALQLRWAHLRCASAAQTLIFARQLDDATRASVGVASLQTSGLGSAGVRDELLLTSLRARWRLGCLSPQIRSPHALVHPGSGANRIPSDQLAA